MEFEAALDSGEKCHRVYNEQDSSVCVIEYHGMAAETPIPSSADEPPQFEVTEQLRDMLFLLGEMFESRGYYDSVLADIAAGRVDSTLMTQEDAQIMLEYRKSKGWKY